MSSEAAEMLELKVEQEDDAESVSVCVEADLSWLYEDADAAYAVVSCDCKPMDSLLLRSVPLWKRAIDVTGAAFGLALFALPMLVIALLIKIISPGPVFFSQNRIGHGGKTFRMHKFRTMVADAEARHEELIVHNMRKGPAFKMKNDPRVTRLGSILRKASLDELPQLFNVLVGEMSLVGPRPLPVREESQLDVWHRTRHLVAPGLTCIWQVKNRDDDRFDLWMRQDMEYVRNQSLWLDIKLLLQTIPAVFMRKKALD